MTHCEETQEALSEQGSAGLTEAQRTHLAGCEDCRAARSMLELAGLPPVSEAELEALAASEGALLSAWKAQQPPPAVISLASRRAPVWRQLTQLALAASLGAVVASAVFLKHPAGGPGAERPLSLTPVVLEEPALPDQAADEANLSDDEVFFDVSWPSATSDGDL
jgi:hypothetical protein